MARTGKGMLGDLPGKVGTVAGRSYLIKRNQPLDSGELTVEILKVYF